MYAADAGSSGARSTTGCPAANASTVAMVRGTGTFEALLSLVVDNQNGGGPPLPVYGFGTRGVGSSTDVTLLLINAGAGTATTVGGDLPGN